MKKLLVLLVTFTYTLSAQQIKYCEYDTTSGVMSNAQEFPTNAVADDFGPRDLEDDWHGGVDFNKCAGAGDSQELIPNCYLVNQEAFEVVQFGIH